VPHLEFTRCGGQPYREGWGTDEVPYLRPARAARRAFTLAELVATITVISILTVVAVPRFANFLRNDRVRRSAGRVAMDLRFAQAEAIKTQRYVTVQFYTAKNAYQTIYSSNGSAVPTAGLVNIGSTPGYRSTLTAADFAGEAEAVFDRFGVPRAGGSVTLGLEDMRSTVTVDATSGRVTISELTRVGSRAATPSPEPQAITFPARKFIAPSGGG
jgi:prepilin-type N-terminal cleavage/methylation domain-containing protein